MEVGLPEKIKPLTNPKRYKFVRGGRGSAKSWSIAKMFLLMGRERELRFLCGREVQKSIEQSVLQLLSDKIDELGLGHFYSVFKTEIRGLNGSLFSFVGFSDLTADNLKSYEGYDYVWIEEAQNTTKNTWTTLTPTIRKDDSEIWCSYNPQLESDFIAVKEKELASAGRAIVIDINYFDNPWFPQVLEDERAHDEATLPKSEYEHKWLGKYMPAVKGAIYFDEVAGAESSGRICRLQYDPLLKVHTIWDLGFNDSMSIILVQRLASEIRIIDYIEDNRRTLTSYVTDDLKPKNFNWGADYLPHDGFAQRHQSGKSDAEVLRALGRSVLQTPNNDVEQGIRNARQVFPRVYFNSESAGVMRLIECLKRYRRHISASTNEAGRPVHDEYSHGGDAFRYLCLVADLLTNENAGTVKVEPIPIVNYF